MCITDRQGNVLDAIGALGSAARFPPAEKTHRPQTGNRLNPNLTSHVRCEKG